ncbi:MAG: hypothetical protein RIG26_14860, partial [Thalassospira sp.]|uniref:hypothetical protein n=1 Tax=Thalassospira sp. TaxID=1912094 RepID=UPI0032EE609C
LNVEDIRTILAELEDQAAEVDRLKRDEILYDELADKQAAEIERLRGALERLASPEAFTVSQVLPRGGLGDECRERMLFAEQALKGEA